MKVLAIAIKDLKQFIRNVPGLAISLAAPLVLTAILGFAFGGMGGSSPKLQVTSVQVANLDQGQVGSTMRLGDELVRALQGPGLRDLMRVTVATDEASARQAVDRRQAEVAIIIPPGFSAAVTAADGQPAEVLLYHDPGLLTRPAIVASAVQKALDAFSGSRVAALVTHEQMAARGAPASTLSEVVGRVAESYAHLAEQAPLLTIATDSVGGPQAVDMQAILSRVNTGMLVFFMFYTAAVAAQSILREDEARTLARLFTTPASRATILAGKFASVFAIVLVQTALLILAGALLFRIRWGTPSGVALWVAASTAAAGGLGLFLMSLARNLRQTGVLLGGVLPVLGMAGGLFTAGISNLPEAFNTLAYFTPHGWAMMGWRILGEGGGPRALLGPAAVCVAIGAGLFAAGALGFKRRYA